MPRRGERPGLRLAVADDARDDQVGVVERHAVGVRQAVAKLTAFVDRARGFRRDVAADVAGEGELLEEPLHPLLVLALVRVDLRVGAFEIGRPEHARRAVARSGDEDHVEIVLDDQPVQVHPHERQRRARAPVTEEAVFHVLGLQRLPQQRVVLQVDHPDGQVVARPPEGVHPFELLRRQRRLVSGFHVRILRQRLCHGGSPHSALAVRQWNVRGRAGRSRAAARRKLAAPPRRRARIGLSQQWLFQPQAARWKTSLGSPHEHLATTRHGGDAPWTRRSSGIAEHARDAGGVGVAPGVSCLRRAPTGPPAGPHGDGRGRRPAASTAVRSGSRCTQSGRTRRVRASLPRQRSRCPGCACRTRLQA